MHHNLVKKTNHVAQPSLLLLMSINYDGHMEGRQIKAPSELDLH